MNVVDILILAIPVTSLSALFIINSHLSEKRKFEKLKWEKDIFMLESEDGERREKLDELFEQVKSDVVIARDDAAYLSKAVSEMKEEMNSIKVSMGWKND